MSAAKSVNQRPPVVTVMGHVDHGKTSLLDKIRESHVADKEIGQITQSIGAYQVEFKNQKITFIDTPGHEAFIKMRSRGAKVADFALLVVAADDGVMPQTKESIRIIKEANVPFLVVINKIDLPTASLDKIKGQLAENEVVIEEYGGKVVAIPVSARTGEGINQLLEMILLMAEMEELKAEPEANLEAIVIESKKDRFRGMLVTVVVKKGTLKLGMEIGAEGIVGKVKAMYDDKGKRVEKATPGDPVEILGFESLPSVGSTVQNISNIDNQSNLKVTLKKEVLPKVSQDDKRLKIIIKADCEGSLEAITNALPSEVNVIFSGIGDVIESDILMAKTVGALIYGFRVRIPGSVTKLAQMEKVKFKNFEIIYDLLKELEDRVLHIMEPMIDLEVFGKAQVIASFDIKGEKIAGAKMLQGKIRKTDKITLERGEKLITGGKIKSLKVGKDDMNEITGQKEFGVIFNSSIDFQKGDVIIAHN